MLIFWGVNVLTCRWFMSLRCLLLLIPSFVRDMEHLQLKGRRILPTCHGKWMTTGIDMVASRRYSTQRSSKTIIITCVLDGVLVDVESDACLFLYETHIFEGLIRFAHCWPAPQRSCIRKHSGCLCCWVCIMFAVLKISMMKIYKYVFTRLHRVYSMIHSDFSVVLL